MTGTSGRCTTRPVVAPRAPAARSAARVAGPVVYSNDDSLPVTARARPVRADGSGTAGDSGRAATAALQRSCGERTASTGDGGRGRTLTAPAGSKAPPPGTVPAPSTRRAPEACGPLTTGPRSGARPQRLGLDRPEPPAARRCDAADGAPRHDVLGLRRPLRRGGRQDGRCCRAVGGRRGCGARRRRGGVRADRPQADGWAAQRRQDVRADEGRARSGSARSGRSAAAQRCGTGGRAQPGPQGRHRVSGRRRAGRCGDGAGRTCDGPGLASRRVSTSARLARGPLGANDLPRHRPVGTAGRRARGRRRQCATSAGPSSTGALRRPGRRRPARTSRSRTPPSALSSGPRLTVASRPSGPRRAVGRAVRRPVGRMVGRGVGCGRLGGRLGGRQSPGRGRRAREAAVRRCDGAGCVRADRVLRRSGRTQGPSAGRRAGRRRAAAPAGCRAGGHRADGPVADRRQAWRRHGALTVQAPSAPCLPPAADRERADCRVAAHLRPRVGRLGRPRQRCPRRRQARTGRGAREAQARVPRGRQHRTLNEAVAEPTRVRPPEHPGNAGQRGTGRRCAGVEHAGGQETACAGSPRAQQREPPRRPDACVGATVRPHDDRTAVGPQREGAQPGERGGQQVCHRRRQPRPTAVRM